MKPTDPCGDREFIGGARKQCRKSLRNTPVGAWLAEALARLEAQLDHTCGQCRFCDTKGSCHVAPSGRTQQVDEHEPACMLFEYGQPMEAAMPDPAIPDGGPCCPACGVPFDQHPGLIPTCRALQEASK